MSDLEQAARQALDALERNVQNKYPHQRSEAKQLGIAAITALRAALAQQTEPVAAPVAFTDAAIEAAITAWFGWNNGPTASMMTDVSGFEGRMRAAIKAACDFKEAK